MPSKSALLLTLSALAVSVSQGAAITENFDNVAGLPGQGWTIVNNSSPAGTTTWFQGNTGVFNSQSGAANSYVAANINATGNNGAISLWLLSPLLLFNNGDVVSFYTRTEGPVSFPDRLEVRLSTNAGSANVGSTATSVGDFTTLLLTVNPLLDTAGYPTDWTRFTAVVTGLSGATSGRLAFRYDVTDSGQLGNNGNYIGIDSFDVSNVPEPSTLLGGLAAGALLLAGRRLRKR